MKTAHRYTLEPYKGMKTRYRCPGCQQKDKTFSHYIDTETGEHIHPSVGRCNRESKCGYHLTPKQYFEENGIKNELSYKYAHARAHARSSVVTLQPKPVSFIPVEKFKKSLQVEKNVSQVAETNHFVKFLFSLFGAEVTSELLSRYFIATSKYQFRNKEFPEYISEKASTVFWQIDTRGKIRTGKIMLYSPSTGKRVKEPFNHINWVHTVLKQPEFELKQCLFGEHLLRAEPLKPVAIVESEKTAVIASVYLPKFIWLAVGSLANLNAEKCSILKGRTVVLFPDLNGFDKWSNKAKELSHLAIFTVSDLLERKATEAERKNGFDLADYLIRFDYNEFSRNKPEKKSGNKKPLSFLISDEVKSISPIERTNTIIIKQDTNESWKEGINKLETFYTGIKFPEFPLKLRSGEIINDFSKFCESHLRIVKSNSGNVAYLPYYDRLFELKKILSFNSNPIQNNGCSLKI